MNAMKAESILAQRNGITIARTEDGTQVRIDCRGGYFYISLEDVSGVFWRNKILKGEKGKPTFVDAPGGEIIINWTRKGTYL